MAVHGGEIECENTLEAWHLYRKRVYQKEGGWNLWMRNCMTVTVRAPYVIGVVQRISIEDCPTFLPSIARIDARFGDHSHASMTKLEFELIRTCFHLFSWVILEAFTVTVTD